MPDLIFDVYEIMALLKKVFLEILGPFLLFCLFKHIRFEFATHYFNTLYHMSSLIIQLLPCELKCLVLFVLRIQGRALEISVSF